jgi:transcriptional regulator with XRE-family HTH domain
LEPITPVAAETGFGPMLRSWRQRRRVSQLDLALMANVSARHISFLETGRARPSRSMVVHLSEFLGVPHGARNTLLQAAGFASAYAARPLDDAAMSPVRAAIDWMLERHAPYPGLALDRRWHVVRANAPARAMLAGAGIDGTPADLLGLFSDPARLETLIENWREVAWHIVLRLHTEALHLGGDAELDAAAARLEAVLPPRDVPAGATMPPFIAMRLRLGGRVLSLFSTISHFGSAEDMALADVKLELFFPADDQTAAFLAAAAG